MPTTYAIIQGNQYMDATTYSAVSTGQTVTNAGSFKPDLVWTKNRTTAGNHYLNNSVRGAANSLNSNTNAAEASLPNYVTSFNTNGFSLGTDNFTTGQNIVGWQWQAGQGTTTVNTSGNTTSNVSVNTTAGFSIVTYTVTTTASMTIGHGLGAVPQLIMEKRYDAGSTANWDVYTASTGNTGRLILNSTAAFDTQAGVWNNTTPTSTVFSQQGNGGWHPVGATCVAYCWAPVAGFSQFGSYTGNGSTDGPFIYTGFRPKYLLIKSSTDATNGEWVILDTSRSTYNANGDVLKANTNQAESSYTGYIDFLSNGFKLRNNVAGSWTNNNGQTYIYAAFAETPFKYANAR
jgi:hypothetical protein